MTRAALTVALAALALGMGATPGAEAGAPYVRGELVVKFAGERPARTVKLPAGVGVRQAASALRANPRVRWAAPNYVATASVWIPNDPGTAPGTPGQAGNWIGKQWNFLPCGNLCLLGAVPPRTQSRGGINAIDAWGNLRDAGRAGAAGVKVAVLDTGIAYRSKGRFRRSPDFAVSQFLAGLDTVDRDSLPLDEHGHGTHIAGTIGERTNNGIGVTGLAYRAKLIPVRVLNERGRGQADDIARGIRFAAREKADVINMSFNFACTASVPGVEAAIRFASRKGAVVIASVGNSPMEACVSAPATAAQAIGVGGITRGGCLGAYSLRGEGVDLVAPGGGAPATPCGFRGNSPILQVTLERGSTKRFGLPNGYVGTSMAAAHVSGVAAMIIASGVLGPSPTPERVLERLQGTARDLGRAGFDTSYGAGLINAARATDPNIP